MNASQVAKLEAMARQWDQCAANSPGTSYLKADPSETYRAYARACRGKADTLRNGEAPGFPGASI